MAWVKYLTVFLCGVVVSSIFTLFIGTTLIQDNQEMWLSHHIRMLEEFDNGDISPSRHILLSNISIVSQDLEAIIESDFFGNCNCM